MKVLLIILVILLAALIVGWVGLRVQPAPLPVITQTSAEVETVPLPEDLPAPVERFYRELYGDEVPVIETAVITGRGTMRVNGITLPVRWRFTHVTGQDYRHYIEATFYGMPILTVNEHYVDGKAILELPFGVSEGTKIDQAANLALWAECGWMPAVWVTDEQARWEPVDENTAKLFVPFGDGEEVFELRFDAETGLLDSLEAMRYRDEESTEKIPWLSEVTDWAAIDGWTTLKVGQATWMDEGTPWAIFNTESMVLNAEVAEYVRAYGP